MKIPVLPPFDDVYKAAYLLVNKEPRRLVILISYSGKRSTMSYARYLLSCKLMRALSKDEHVDHIDGDRMNDDIENLQILSVAENSRKAVRQNGRTMQMIEFVCPGCKNTYTRPKNKSHLSRGGLYDACSRPCCYKVLKMGLSKREMEAIGKNQILSIFRRQGS